MHVNEKEDLDRAKSNVRHDRLEYSKPDKPIALNGDSFGHT